MESGRVLTMENSYDWTVGIVTGLWGSLMLVALAYGGLLSAYLPFGESRKTLRNWYYSELMLSRAACLPSPGIFSWVWRFLYLLAIPFSRIVLTLYPFYDSGDVVFDAVSRGAYIAMLVLLAVDLVLNFMWMPLFSLDTSFTASLWVIVMDFFVCVAILILALVGGFTDRPDRTALDVLLIIALSLHALWLLVAANLNRVAYRLVRGGRRRGNYIPVYVVNKRGGRR